MLKEITKSLDKFFIVSNLPLFQELRVQEKIFIANRSQIVEYSSRDILYRQGSDKDALYIVIAGRIGLYHPTERLGYRPGSRRNDYIEILRKGDYVGLISLLTGKHHSVSAIAITDTRVLRIEHGDFKEIIDEIPKLAVQFSKVLSRRVHIKETRTKEVFQTVLLSVVCPGNEAFASRYARDLGGHLHKESNKKVLVISVNKEGASCEKADIDSHTIIDDDTVAIEKFIDARATDYHFIVLDLPETLKAAEQSVIAESDYTHVVFTSYDTMLEQMTRIMQKIKRGHDGIKIILQEELPLSRKIDRDHVYATLPREDGDYDKVLRRIARDVSQVLVGLALGAGGALGLAEIGILSVFEEEKIPVDFIAGTSMGALIAGFWAAGFNSREIEKICGSINTVARALKLVDITVPKQGFISGKKVRDFLTTYLGNKTFHDVRMPLRIVACDIRKREEVVISSGKLVDAIMAS
ncbi:MAG: cyclic nucleotide-binding and patatin-like phospholipase domain-containing protein, partial [Candidatus Omnitrophica bacterium]|nr:cyclic nucleotide-binding and patatin-like phospholipase domain-containing protein [Candidatus Omnitrophota bacterium]